ncbi:hypothetical protein GobsT_53690 [Gemmata obscuriglobus]|uniref:Uncharacterized protein n=1 Tax=Gemmata obscuriglobus TaxID=114 RepID=A0A2Z3GU33_9BACT|nr:hypothetical protein [Gemmata obscuriglobus]AWM36778.1 hypothetical protein C1280_06920 [Gemmata obscuriglobus]QEG30564.1 hypothetical protein GobsT_53690 [Gemmata obscuriglobus]VTS09888.1 unnamed protein product [Gemmata obscuriglobus UQM 2246]
MSTRSILPFALAVGPALAAALPVTAAEPGALVAGYGTEFYEYWTGLLKQQNGVVMAALGFGAVCLFIITRGKWRK